MDTTHFPGPRTTYLCDVFPPSATAGFGRGFSAYGLPFELAFLPANRQMYARLSIAPRSDWDRLDAAAEDAFSARRWRADLENWASRQAPTFRAANLDKQRVDLRALDDEALAAHVESVAAHLRDGIAVHMELVSLSLPVGEFLMAAIEGGLSPKDATAALAGSASAVAEAATRLSTEEDYLAEYGWRMTSQYDINGRCLFELPDAYETARNAAATRRPSPGAVAIPEQAVDLLDDARLLYGFEEDNAGITWLWPLGLARRALLEAAQRLDIAPDVLAEATEAELAALLTGDTREALLDLHARADERRALSAVPAPRFLGEPDELDLNALPEHARRAADAFLALGGLAETQEAEPLHGTGVGDRSYRGRARVAVDLAEVLDTLQPGEILVTPFTTPAHTPLVLTAGALVVEEGGPMCHAAVLARELGIPATIGARGALATIKNGDELEVDPVAGVVRIL
jgi:pyruvate,water dikinase